MDGGVEGDRAAAVAELVGDEPDRRRGVERGIQARGAPAERRGHETTGVDEADDVAVLFDPILVAHRPTEARRRPPVHLPDVVVGQVVADRLEVRAEPERAAAALTALEEAPARDG